MQTDRVNELSGCALDDYIPLTWVDQHVLVSKDLSLSAGFHIQWPDTLFISDEQGDQLHNSLTSMLNQMALLDNMETRLQWITICHNDYSLFLQKYLETLPDNNSMIVRFKRDILDYYYKQSRDGGLRRYESFLFVGLEPIVPFNERITRVRRLQKMHWLQRMQAFFQDALELSYADAARMTEDEWNLGVSLLAKYCQQTNALLKMANIRATLMNSDNLLELLYWWFNPKSYAEGLRNVAHDPENPRPVSYHVVNQPLRVNPVHGWIHMDGIYRRILTLHEPPTQLQFGMMLPQLLAPSLVSGAMSVECISANTGRRLRRLKNKRLQLLGRVDKQPELRGALLEVEHEIDLIASGKDRPWNACHSLHLWSENLEQLNNLVLEQRQIGQQAENMAWIHETTPIFQYYIKTLPGYMSDRDRYRNHAYSSAQLATMLPALTMSDGSDGSLAVLFKTRQGTLYNYDTHDQKNLTNYNVMIAGSSGSGKSVVTNLILLQKLAAGAYCVGVDIGGSYQKLCRLVGGNYITMDLDREDQRFNFLHTPPGIYPTETDLMQNALLIERMLVDSDRDQINKEDRLLLVESLRQAYHAKVPKGEEVILSDLQKILENNTQPNARSMAMRLRGWCRGGSYGRLFDGPSMITAKNNFTVFDFTKQKDNRDVGPIMMMMATRFAQTMTMAYKDKDKIFFIDEGWHLMNSPICAAFLEEAARTYRKYGIAILFISQGISEWGALKNAEGIRDSISTFFLFKLSDAVIDETIAYIRGHEGDAAALRSLSTDPGRYSQCYFIQRRVNGMQRNILEITMPPLLYAATTTRPADQAEIERLRNSGLSLQAALAEFSQRYPHGVQIHG